MKICLFYIYFIDKEHALENILSEVTLKVKEDVSSMFKTLQENKQQVI